MPKTKSQQKNWQIQAFRQLLSGYIGGGWGSEIKDSEFPDPGYVIRGTDIPAISKGDIQSLPFRFHKKSNIKTRKLNEGDLVFEVSGGSKGQPVGRAALVRSKILNQLDQDVIPASFCKRLIPDEARVDATYLFYFLQKIYQSAEIEQWQVQSTGISNFKFEKFLDECFVELPQKPVQKQIADVLSTYDELIENNTRRIQILEELAQAIYKEWFVYFRFPGHEKVKMIDSGTEFGMIPKGWEAQKVCDVFIVKYGKNLPTKDIKKTGEYSVYGAGGVIGFYNENNSEGKVTLVTCRGNGSGTVWRTRGTGFVTNNSFTISPKKEFGYLEFSSVYFMLQSANVSSAISGSAQPQITIESINFVNVVVPNEDLVKSFQVVVNPLFALIDDLFESNKKLQQARDFLLPKLVTGEIEVK